MADGRRALSPNELGFGILFDAINEAVIVADAATDRILLWNKAAERLFGYSSNEAFDMPVNDLVPAAYRERHRQGMQHYAQTGHGRLIDGQIPFEMPAITKDGREIRIEMTLSLVPMAPAGSRIVLAIIRDVTERQRAEQELRSRQQELESAYRQLGEQQVLMRAILEHLPAAVGYVGQDLVFRWVNPAYAALVGRSAEAMMRRSMQEVIPEVAAQLAPMLDRVRAEGRPVSTFGYRLMLPGPTGRRETFWDLSIVPIFDERRAIAGYLSLSLEVTEREQLERAKAQLQADRIRALEEADELKDQFISILSHELRTPINAITGFGSILDDEVVGPLEPQQHEYVQKMLKGADTLLSLIDDLLDMSRLHAGRFSLQEAPFNLGVEARLVLETLQPLAEQKSLRLRSEIPSLPDLTGDAGRIRQVLVNLVNNAVKFTPAGGAIVVRACDEGDRLRCEVSDTGIGIAPEDLPKLFKPFSQVDMSSTRKVGGTGLGLSISKALVEAHGGAIGVESTPGKGSTFWFTLPKRKGPKR